MEYCVHGNSMMEYCVQSSHHTPLKAKFGHVSIRYEFFIFQSMAKSQYEYVKYFEQDDSILKQCWIVVRLDGKGFTKYVHDIWSRLDVK